MENITNSNIQLRNDEEDERESLFSDSSSNRSPSRSRDRSNLANLANISNQGNQRDYHNKRDQDDQRSQPNIGNRNYNRRNESEEKKFIMKNGCCRECMRAFSKTGKSCLCQVPKMERKYTLPDKGCNFCGCHGCNPIDVRKDKRKDLKRQLKDDKNILYKKQRLLDSDDEDLKIHQNDIDEWNKKRSDLLHFLSDSLKSSPYTMGFGVPLRTSSYILGYQPTKGEGDNSDKHNNHKNSDYKRRRRDRSRTPNSPR